MLASSVRSALTAALLVGLGGCGGTVDGAASSPTDAASDVALDATQPPEAAGPREGSTPDATPADGFTAIHPSADACDRRTCADFPTGTCGAQSDGCGGMTAICAASDAGLCPPSQFCGGGGPGLCGFVLSVDANACFPPGSGCTPKDCLDYTPGVCGQQGDGCGGITPDCAMCPSPLVCSAGLCSWPADAGPCVPSTCQSLGVGCGLFTDGCGDTIDCGSCPVGQFCDGFSHRCGGTCAPPDPCGLVHCTSDAGSCVDDYPCGSPDGGCGLVRGRCSGLFDCGPCAGDGGAPDAPAAGEGGIPQCGATQACVGYPSFGDWVCRDRCGGDGGACPSGQTCTSVSGCCVGTACSAISQRVCVP